MKEVYLVLTRYILKRKKSRHVWSEWHTFSIDVCFNFIEDAFERVSELRKIAESKHYDFVDYCVQTLFVH